MMRLGSLEPAADAKTRLIGIRASMLTLRLMTNWSRLFGSHEFALQHFPCKFPGTGNYHVETSSQRTVRTATQQAK